MITNTRINSIQFAGVTLAFLLVSNFSSITIAEELNSMAVSTNTAPAITSFSVSPNPVIVKNTITFKVDWSDADAGDKVKVHVCKTNSIIPSNTGGSCSGNQWVSSASLTSSDPATVTYTTTDIGTKTYYVFVCDDDPTKPKCSGAVNNSGTFNVQNLTIKIILNPSSGNAFPEPDNFLLSGCNVIPNKHDGNPASQTFTADPDCTLTISPVTARSDSKHRWDFNNNRSSITINTGSTNNTSFTRYYYETYTQTFSYANLPSTPPTLSYTGLPITESDADNPRSVMINLNEAATDYYIKEGTSWTVIPEKREVVDIDCSDITNGLVGCWRFENSAYDGSGNNNNGTLINNPTFIESDIGFALNLDGIDDYVRISDNTKLRLNDAFSISVWIKFNNLPPKESLPRIVYKGADNNNLYTMIYDSNVNKILFKFVYSGTSVQLYTNKSDWVIDRWYHIVGTYDPSVSSNNMKLYVDGIVDNEGTRSGKPSAPLGNLLLGGAQTDKNWDGGIDEVRIYNRALNATEVQTLFQGGYDMLYETYKPLTDTVSSKLISEFAYYPELNENVTNVNFSVAWLDGSNVESVAGTGDLLSFSTGQLVNAKEINDIYPELMIGVSYTSITDLENSVPTLPTYVDWVVYNYERNESPDFNTDQQITIDYLDRAKSVAGSKGKKLAVSFTYASTKNLDWDFGEIAKHIDMMHFQVQGIQSDFNLAVETAKARALEVKSKSPDTIYQPQLSYLREGFEDIPALIAKLSKDPNIDGIAILMGDPQYYDDARNAIQLFKSE